MPVAENVLVLGGAGFIAPRPRSEMLENANLTAIGINLMRPWRVALRDYILG
jgi:hypothetical protein